MLKGEGGTSTFKVQSVSARQAASEERFRLAAARREARRPQAGLKRSRPATRVPYAADPHSGDCWFKEIPSAGPCDGGLVRCHLIDKQVLRKEFPHGFEGHSYIVLQADPRSWVWGCGGPTGLGGHHGLFDSLKLHIPRILVPLETEQMADELGLGWWLDRTYGPIEEVA